MAGTATTLTFWGRTTVTVTNIPGRRCSLLFGTPARTLIVRVVESIVGSMATMAPSDGAPAAPSTAILTTMPTLTVASCCWGSVKST